ncbi:MAG: molybdopterin molybdotransferase MoeA [Rhodospirillales bacterium]|nr:molybdopterin molybdotransferase MoeA [Rhodospirillales bacterium]
MAETANDCFRPAGELMKLDAALALLAERIKPVAGTETAPLARALDRTLAETLTAERDVPPHDNAAVDGFAVRFADVAADGETRLPVTGRVAAGHPLGRPARPAEALRIFTGALVPEGIDTIVMQEDCRLEGENVVFGPGLRAGVNLRRRGEDVRAGDVILEEGIRLRPQEIGLAASVGRATLRVRAPLRAAVFSTGDEVRDPGTPVPEGCIYDANRYVIGGLLAGLGCTVTDLGILPDRLPVIRQALERAAADHHLIITSGGISVGDEDHVRAAVEALGHLHLWRLAIKPGRPLALGQVGGAVFAGLPGNPVAAMVTFLRIVRPVILTLAGRRETQPRCYKVRAAFAYRKKAGRREFLRAHLVTDAGGEPRAVKYAADGSGVLTSMVAADGLVELPEWMEAVKDGDVIDFLPFAEVL